MLKKISKEKKMGKKVKTLLNQRGFIVDMKCSKHTNSVYLRLDNGACRGIRISDHKKISKYKSSYKYNVINGYQGARCKIIGGQLNYYYNFNNIGRLVSNIETERASKIIKYGYSNYRKIRDRQLDYNTINYIKKVA